MAEWTSFDAVHRSVGTKAVERWDDDQDFEFSSTVDPTEAEGHDSVHANTGQESEMDDLGDDSDEQGDTLKVSDLTSETLAQLASYAKKSTTTPSQPTGSHVALDLENARSFKETQLDTDGFEDERDWDEDLEIPDSFSIDSLKLRKSSVISDADFETPSIGSVSDATASSFPSDSQPSLGPVTPSKHRQYGKSSSSSSATSSLHLSPSRHFKQNSTKKFRPIGEDWSNQSSESKGAEVDVAELTERTTEQHSSRAHQKLLPSQRLARHSASSLKSSDDTGPEDEQTDEMDELDFDAFGATNDDVEGQSLTLADRLRAKLVKMNQKPKSEVDQLAVNAIEADFASGLVIEDDMDLSPSRLRARNLNNRLREAAHLRRRKQEGKKKEIADLRDQSQEASSEPQMHSSLTVTEHAFRASTAASRAREAEIRSSSPIQSSRTGQKGRFGHISPISSPSSSPLLGLSSSVFPARPKSRASDRTSDVSAKQTPLPSAFSDGVGSAPSQAQSSRDRPGVDAHSRRGKPIGLPRSSKVYGDGRELDGIEDLLPGSERTRKGKREGNDQTAYPSSQKSMARSGPSSVADGTPASSTRKRRPRKKKQPYLIRNLGTSAGSTTKMVGDMRWNPSLKRWEGNEQEGREFANAVRGSGRPALITRLSLGSSGIAVGAAITTPPPSSTGQGGSKATSGSPHVVGDMLFDPVTLRWVRQDGREDADPFDSVLDEEDEEKKELVVDRGTSEEPEAEPQNRKLRPRTVSADLTSPRFDSDTHPRQDDNSAGGTVGMEFVDAQRLIGESLRSQRTASQPPAALRSILTTGLWNASIEAHRRHEREIIGFLPRQRFSSRHSQQGRHTDQSVMHDSRPPRPRPQSAAPDGESARRQGQGKAKHLYLIQSLARRHPGAS